MVHFIMWIGNENGAVPNPDPTRKISNDPKTKLFSAPAEFGSYPRNLWKHNIPVAAAD